MLFRSVELYGGPHDGRVISLPNLPNEVYIPNPISFTDLIIKDINDIKPIIFTNSVYVAEDDIENMKVNYKYNGGMA